jgi:hypothetical protein
MFRFTTRDVLWLTVLVALGVGWWMDRTSLSKQVRDQGPLLSTLELALEVRELQAENNALRQRLLREQPVRHQQIIAHDQDFANSCGLPRNFFRGQVFTKRGTGPEVRHDG